MKLGLAILFTGLLLGWCIARGACAIVFDKYCGGHLKRAADATNFELAGAELQKALAYADQERLTVGYTSILYQTPDEDVGFWYNNLRAALAEVQNIRVITPLERSNLLMKLRETLVDQTEYGVEVTCPDGISVYPNNTVFALFLLLFSLGTCVFWGGSSLGIF